MTLQQLKYALTIADCGSMNEAAKTLFLSQPSLSETIRELETEIGFDLFVRSNRGILVTPEGEEFLGYARQVTEQFTPVSYTHLKDIRYAASIELKEDEQSAIGGITIPFHKGAAAYYAECGIEVPTE